MTTVNVVLTPGIDTDQYDSAQAQISAVPSGTASNPTIINMPAGRYRIDGPLNIVGKSHIRWTCLAGVPTYPNPPNDSQAFVAYTDKTGLETSPQYKFGSRSARYHFLIHTCTNVIASFLRIEGPNVFRQPSDPPYARYQVALEGEHGFYAHISTDCGFEDCSYQDIWGDGVFVGGYLTVGGVKQTNRNIHAYRITGTQAGRMGNGIVMCVGLDCVDGFHDYSGWGGIDVEPSLAQTCWDLNFERQQLGCWYYPITITGWTADPMGDFGYNYNHGNLRFKDIRNIRCHTTSAPALADFSQNGGYLVIDGLTDLRQRSNVGLIWFSPAESSRCDNITITNCRISTRVGGASTTESYAVQANTAGVLTITNNNFNAIDPYEGFDHLYTAFDPQPATVIHYGNVWAKSTQNDGLILPDVPVVLPASPGQIVVAGRAATLSVVPAVVPQPPFIPPYVGGAPYRMGSPKGWSRLRGAAGARVRGTSGLGVRHAMRLRSSQGADRLRSVNHPSYLRSLGPVNSPPVFLAASAAQIVVQGGTAVLSTRTVNTAGQIALTGGTATLAVVNTVFPVPAAAGAIALAGGTATLPMRLVATSGHIALTGAATLSRVFPETSGQVVIAGGTALLSVRIAATSGQVEIAGGAAGINGQVSVSATSGTISLSGGTATLSVRTAPMTSGHVAIQGGTATLALGATLHATPGELAIIGGRAGLHILHRVGTGTITIQGGTAELGATEHVYLSSTAGQIHINGGTAHLNTYNQYPEWPMGTLSDEWEMADA